MADFYVHWNTALRRVRIHRSECSVRKQSDGMHEDRIAADRGTTWDWEPADSFAEALAIVKALKHSKPILVRPGTRIECGLCHPGR